MRATSFLTIVAAMALAASAHAASIGSGILDPVDSRLSALQGELSAGEQTPDVKKDLRQVGQLRRLLVKKKTAKTVANEAKAGAKVAKVSANFKGTDEELQAVVAAARDAHHDLALSAVEALDTLIAQISAKNPGRARKRLEKRRNKIQSFAGLAAAATDEAAAYKLTAKALKAAGPYLGGGEKKTWVISGLGASDDGLDLDGDGARDNALSALLALAADFGQAIDIDALLADTISSGDAVTLLEIWNLDSLVKDSFIGMGMVAGQDTDADPGDNFTGTEQFEYALGLDPDGNPTARAATSLAKSKFDVVFTGEEQTIGGITLPANGVIRAVGTVREATVTGTFGIALPVAEFLDLVESATGAAVPLLLQFAVTSAADIDLDGNGRADALSMAFDFESVRATAVPAAP